MIQQEMFDRVARHLLTQKAQSLNEWGKCAYRGEEGRMCAIGALMPDDKYKPEFDLLGGQSAGCPKIMEACGYGLYERDLAVALQVVHDDTPPESWRAELRAVAERFNLIWSEVP